MSGHSGGADPAERVRARIVGEPVFFEGADVLEFRAHIRYLADGSIALDRPAPSQPLPPVAVGTPLKISRTVVGDAVYVFAAHVSELLNDGALRLGVGGRPERTQRRDHVRVLTLPFPVTLRLVPEVDGDLEPDDEDDLADGAFDVAVEGEGDEEEPPFTAALRDVSGGGARVVLDARLEDLSVAVGVKLHMTTSLTSDGGTPLAVDLDAEVRWVEDLEGHQMLGLRFLGVTRRIESELTRWVFAEEARQSRITRR